MLDTLALVLRWLCALCRLRGDLALENLALRQQLTVLSRHHPRPRLTSVDRLFWVMLRRVWASVLAESSRSDRRDGSLHGADGVMPQLIGREPPWSDEGRPCRIV